MSHKGQIVLERYFNGARAAQAANIKSASKSVISALVGIAIAQGQIKSVDQRIVDYFPELANDPEPRKRDITIEDLLTMRSGLESTSGRNYGAWVQSPNWVRFVLRRPLIDEPGTRVEYSTGSSHLLSAILTKATKMSTWQFAQDNLAKPLGFTLAKWTADPQGIYFGGNEMSDDAAPDDRVRRAVSERRESRRSTGDCEIVDRSHAGAARPIAMGQRSRVRLRLLDSRVRRPRQLLRVGLRRAIHLHRSRTRISSSSRRQRSDVIHASGATTLDTHLRA